MFSKLDSMVLHDACCCVMPALVQVEWGIDLATEHERWLAEEHFKQPVIVYNYPREIKSFYMKLNPDGKTVAAMDVLVPKVAEGGGIVDGVLWIGTYVCESGGTDARASAY